jgi:hypothetical protein
MVFARNTSMRSSMPVPGVDPAVFPAGPIQKVSGGGTYTMYVPWDYCRFTYADCVTETIVANEDMVITIVIDGTTVGTITVATSSSAEGLWDEIASLVTKTCKAGDTITITTTDSAQAGVAFLNLYFEPSTD